MPALKIISGLEVVEMFRSLCSLNMTANKVQCNRTLLEIVHLFSQVMVNCSTEAKDTQIR
jgi:hypothetical protein